MLEPCALSGGVEAMCGVLPVPENRDLDNGRMIDLHLAVLPAGTSMPEPDPLFMLAGGPGQSALEVFPPLVSLLTAVNDERDIVLVDQRGTGKSNPLQCPELEGETTDPDLTDDEVVALLQACMASLAETADLNQYTTAVAMRDLDAVRQALGYERINLYGASYGTRAAQVYAHLFPERVRTLTLDAVTGPELVLFLQMPRDGQRALEALIQRCRDEEACAEAFPDLEEEYRTILERLDTEPRVVELRHPQGGKLLSITLTRERLANLVFSMLYSPELASLFPLLVHEAYITNNYEALVVQGLVASDSTGMNLGLLYAVTCAEDAPLIDMAEARRLQEETLFALRAEGFLEICSLVPPAAAEEVRQPLNDDIPTLLLSGENDPVTPPRYAEQVAASLPTSRHLVLPGYGHGLIAVGCMPEILADFLEAGAVDGLETACLQGRMPPPFFDDFTGPGP
jgi:pimeloyl-ACP methyl ester carboxylesterase